MEYSNVFNRTACFLKEKMDSGQTRVRRIPWDLIEMPVKGAGFFVAPEGIITSFDGRVQTAAYYPEFADLINDPQPVVDKVDEVVAIQWFETEQMFYAQFENVFGFYNDGDNVSAEFGYPCV